MKILGMGLPELVIILVVILLIFGPRNLPKLGSALGRTMKNLRQGMNAGKVEEAADKKAVEAGGAGEAAATAAVGASGDAVEEVVVEDTEAPKRTVRRVVRKKAETQA